MRLVSYSSLRHPFFYVNISFQRDGEIPMTGLFIAALKIFVIKVIFSFIPLWLVAGVLFSRFNCIVQVYFINRNRPEHMFVGYILSGPCLDDFLILA